MNSLSILIYAVGMITNLGNWAVAGIIFFGIATCINLFVWCFRRFPDYNKPNADQIALISKTHGKWRNRFIAMFFLCVAINVFIPDRTTTIMIAASEVAEIVYKSEEAQSVMKDVGGLGSDAIGLLKTYIKTEQTKLMDEIKTMTEPTKGNVNAEPNKT